MKYENEKLGCSFTLPDAVTVRKQLAFWEAVGNSPDESLTLRTWAGFPSIVEDWNCPALPDLTASIDAMSDPVQAQIILWAAARTMEHMGSLGSLPKG